jgi:hypothetical protein
MTLRDHGDRQNVQAASGGVDQSQRYRGKATSLILTTGKIS